MFDKPLNRKHNVKFNPKQALDLIKQGPMPEYLDEDARRGLLQAYIDVSNFGRKKIFDYLSFYFYFLF